MPAELVALLLCERGIFQERFLFGSNVSPNPLVVKPLDDWLGIDLGDHSDNTLKDNSSDCDLPGGTRTSLRVPLNRWRSRFHRNAERLGPGFGGKHWGTSFADLAPQSARFVGHLHVGK